MTARKSIFTGLVFTIWVRETIKNFNVQLYKDRKKEIKFVSQIFLGILKIRVNRRFTFCIIHIIPFELFGFALVYLDSYLLNSTWCLYFIIIQLLKSERFFFNIAYEPVVKNGS